jgi:DUF1680 family protein
LCLESVDLPGDRDVDAVHVDTTVPPVEKDSSVMVKAELAEERDEPWPYHDGSPIETGAGAEKADQSIDVRLIAYHDWANRGPATMRVWLPTAAGDR